MTTENAATEKQAKLRELLDDAKIVMLTTAENGQLHSRPMTVQRVDEDASLWFIAPKDAIPPVNVEGANVAFQSRGAWVSVAGSLSEVKDPAARDELLDAATDAWTDGGKESQAALKLSSRSAQYWAQEKGNVATAVELIKAKVSGGQPDVGTSETVEL